MPITWKQEKKSVSMSVPKKTCKKKIVNECGSCCSQKVNKSCRKTENECTSREQVSIYLWAAGTWWPAAMSLSLSLHFHELPMTGPMRGPLEIVPCPRLFTISFRLSSQVLSALRRCITLSRLPCRTSLILTDPIFTSLSRRKSNNRNRPSSLSSLCPEGNAESGIGGEADLPIMSSASRRSARPPNRGPAGSVTWCDLGKCEFAQSTRLLSVRC
jgi:hypothetical protein